MTDENVLCIKDAPLEHMAEVCYDLIALDNEAMVENELAFYIPRSKAETDETYRQVIPYVVFENHDNGQTKIFVYERGHGVGEKRLRSKYSFGFGGHIREGESLLQGITRELYEEIEGIQQIDTENNIEIPFYDSFSAQDLICLYDTPVDRVHVGIPFFFEAPRKIKTKESELLESGWQSPEKIGESLNNLFENWSRVIYGRCTKPGGRWNEK